MATMTQQITGTLAVNQALSNLQSQSLATEHYLESYLANIDMLDPVFTAINNTTMAGSLSNGDQFNFTGSNLLGFPATLNTFYYAASTGLSFNASGALTVQNTSGTATGGFTSMQVTDNRAGQNISYSYEGNFAFDASEISRMQATTPTYSIELTGDMGFDANDQPIGTASSMQMTINGQITTINDINLDISHILQNGDYANLLTQVLSGNDLITGGTGNDTLQGYAGDDIINGAEGYDTAVFNINQADIISVRSLKSGGISISSSEGQDTLINVEMLDFLDNDISVTTLLNSLPTESLANDAHNQSAALELYTGPVNYLQYQMIGGNEGEIYTGTEGNDFINLLGGDDAADGAGGDDVLDGGIGSNFLTGGGGDDTFFLDGRSGATTWSTITDFNNDEVNIWGWVEGQSQLLVTEANAGAEGYEGVTYHYDLDSDGTIDTSVTFTGLSEGDIQTSAHTVEGNGYLLMT